jgi:CRP/FNR family transcriptional regulator, cyclic AMP receptor protein
VRLRRDSKVDLIRKVPLFSQCTKRELTAIAAAADLIEVPEGMALVTEGGHDRELMVIVDGNVEVRRGGRKIATLESGEFFGEIAMISGGPRTATVTTTSPSSLLVIGERQFGALVEETPSIATSVLQVLGERFQPKAV